jgi:hypothetical protein
MSASLAPWTRVRTAIVAVSTPVVLYAGFFVFAVTVPGWD